MAETPAKLDSPSHFQMRTCTLCRHRRVKCDRQIPRCSNCVRSEADCVYPPGQGRARKRPRLGFAPQLSERLSHLESIINQIGASGQEINQAQESSLREADDSAAHSFDQDFSRLKVDNTKSYYVNNALWVTLSNQVEELRDLLFEPASEDVKHEMTTSQYPAANTTTDTTPAPQLGLNSSIFGYRAISSSLESFHPPLSQAVALFAAFTDNVLPLVHIFHMPTLTRTYWDAISSLDMVDKDTEALLFAIHYSAVVSLTPGHCLEILGEMRETALERYRFAVEQALARGNLLITQSMTMLQASVLFLSALPNSNDSRAAWSLTSLIFHIARTMGLHRDGTFFALKPLETELRRRLWWQICIIDNRSSEYHCSEAIARGFASDTKPPLHINDRDLSSEMVEPPTERWDQATDMTFFLIRCEAIQTGWELSRAKQNPLGGSDHGNAPGGENYPRQSAKHRRALVEGLEAKFHNKYLPLCNSSVPLELLSSAVARVILARFWLVTKYSAMSREGEDDKTCATTSSSPPGSSPESADRPKGKLRDDLFRISVSLLEISAMLLTNRDLTQWAWHSKTHIQWGALAFVLSELCDRPQSPECDQAWQYVTTVYEGRRLGGSEQDDVSRLTLWRPIRRLMAKARYVREMQQTERPKIHQAQRPGYAIGQQALLVDNVSSQYPLTASSSSAWTAASQQKSSGLTPGLSLPGISTSLSPPTLEPRDAPSKVLGSESLDPFMDLLPGWSWAHYEDNSNLPFGDSAHFCPPPGYG